MVVNPFYLLLFLFSVSMGLTFKNGFEIEGFYVANDFHYASKESYLHAFLTEAVTLFAIFFVYYFYVVRRYYDITRYWIGYPWILFLIINQVAYIIFFSVTGVGVAGSNFGFDGFNLFNYYFILTNPDLLAFLIIPLTKSKRLAFFSLGLVLLSLLMRGWLAGILYLNQ